MTSTVNNQPAAVRHLSDAAELTLIEQTEDWYAFNKSAGVPFQSELVALDNHTIENAEGEGQKSTLYGMVELVKNQFQGDSYAVHRLDKVTSGLQLFARTKAFNQRMSAAFRERHVQKYYIALSHKRPSKKQGWVKGDMVKSRGGSYKLVRSLEQPAITQFAACSVSYSGQPMWLFLLKPYTGQTHQLRVAMKALGAPILGDVRYGGAPAQRCFLHAWQLSFDDLGTTYNLCAKHHWGDELELPLATLRQKLAR